MRPRPTGSTSTSTASAATTSRRRSRALRPRGRVALCGAVSQYGRAARGPANLFQATANDLTLRGFRGSSHLHRMGDMVRDVGGWLADGRLRYRETIVDGLERAPAALARMLAGDTIGKTLVRIA